MSSVILPTWPAPSQAEPTYLDFGTTLDGGPHGGGPRIHRLGNRFSLAVTMPRSKMEPGRQYSGMKNGVGARVFLSRLRQGMDRGVIFPWPQPGLAIGAPGDPTVAAAIGPNLEEIVVQNLTPGYVFREGQFFNLYRADGRAMLAHTTEEVEAGLDGRATLPILPRTRASIALGSRVNMEPVIEGRLSGDSQSWTISTALTTGITFTVTEYGNNE